MKNMNHDSEGQVDFGQGRVDVRGERVGRRQELEQRRRYVGQLDYLQAPFKVSER